jgi:hypothetical protein
LTRTHLAAAVALVLLAPSAATARGASTPAERRRAVETTRKLEREPLAKTANADRRWLLQWIVEIPDVNIRILYAQAGFGMATFIIEHRDREKDWVGVQVAGLESVLRAYQAIVKKDRSARVPALDDLEADRKRGKLRAVVGSEMKGCDPEAMGNVPEDSI